MRAPSVDTCPRCKATGIVLDGNVVLENWEETCEDYTCCRCGLEWRQVCVVTHHLQEIIITFDEDHELTINADGTEKMFP